MHNYFVYLGGKSEHRVESGWKFNGLWIDNLIATRGFLLPTAADHSLHKAGQIEFAVYRHRPHGFSDFLQNFQVSDAIQ